MNKYMKDILKVLAGIGVGVGFTFKEVLKNKEARKFLGEFMKQCTKDADKNGMHVSMMINKNGNILLDGLKKIMK